MLIPKMPKIDSLITGNRDNIVVYYDSGYYAFKSHDMRYYDTSNGYDRFVLPVSIQKFGWDGSSWVYITDFNVETKPSIKSGSLVYTNFDIRYSGSDEVFFSPPVPPKYQITVAEMGQVSLGSLMTDFGQTLGALLPVGLILSSMVLALYLVRRFLPLFGLSSK